MPLDDLRDCMPHAVFVANVAGERVRAPAVRVNLGRYVRELVRVAAEQRDVRAERREFVRAAAADAAAAARDERDLAFEAACAKL